MYGTEISGNHTVRDALIKALDQTQYWSTLIHTNVQQILCD